jgi:hypothetical protein
MGRPRNRNVVLLLGFFTAPLFAEPTASRPASSLPAKLSWVKFSIVLGRLHALNAHYGQSLSKTEEDPEAGWRETFSINVSEGRPTVRYESRDPAQVFLASFAAAGDVSIERRPVGEAAFPPVMLTQLVDGPITLAVGAGDAEFRYEGETIWHLFLDQPEVCELHLVPALRLLRPDWPIVKTAQELENQLLDRAGATAVDQRRHWRTLVDELGNAKFTERRSAQRELMRVGQPVAVFLRQLDKDALDAEQRRRVRELTRALATQAADTPTRVAAWMVDDRDAWMILLNRNDARVRSIASRHLSRVLGEPIDFDPEATPETRREQIARLQTSLTKN